MAAGFKAAGDLPTPLTSLIGRDNEVSELRRLATRSRLVTLTGVGGVGKTRLAIAVASDLAATQADGAWFCDLSAISEPSLVPHSLAAALGIAERADRTVTETLQGALNQKQLLVVIDNCEHLLDASGRLIAGLLTACPGIHVIATSREPLQSAGEVVWTVAPLGLADPGSTHPAVISRSPAVQLFVARARDASPGFRLDAQNAKTIARVCERLDGIPLAVELCAARIRTMPADELLLRLEDRLALLMSHGAGTPLRQRTLQASLSWSYELLDDAERALFRRLSVFAGTFDLDAVASVCAGGPVPSQPLMVLAALADKSLVSTAPSVGGRARYRLLETVRQFSRERLKENRELDAISDQHARHFLAVAEEGERQLHMPDQVAWLERLSADHANFGSALEWSRMSDLPMVPSLAASLAPYWNGRGHYTEGRQWLTAALEIELVQSGRRSSLLRSDGLMAWRQGQFDVARQRLTEALTIERGRNDKRSLGYVLGSLGFVLFGTEDFRAAAPLFEEELSLAREVGDPTLLAIALQHCGILALQLERLSEAHAHYAEALRTFRELSDTQGVAFISQMFGLVLILEGDLKGAAQVISEAVQLQAQLRNGAGLAGALGAAAELAAAQGRHDRALVLDGAAEARLNLIGANRASLFKASRERWMPAALLKVGSRARSFAERGARLSDEQVLAFATAGSDQLPPMSARDDLAGLTQRELEVGELVATGLTNRQIASKLHLSKRTVDAHTEHIRDKLGVRTRVEIAALLPKRDAARGPMGG